MNRTSLASKLSSVHRPPRHRPQSWRTPLTGHRGEITAHTRRCEMRRRWRNGAMHCPLDASSFAAAVRPSLPLRNSKARADDSSIWASNLGAWRRVASGRRAPERRTRSTTSIIQALAPRNRPILSLELPASAYAICDLYLRGRNVAHVGVPFPSQVERTAVGSWRHSTLRLEASDFTRVSAESEEHSIAGCSIACSL